MTVTGSLFVNQLDPWQMLPQQDEPNTKEYFFPSAIRKVLGSLVVEFDEQPLIKVSKSPNVNIPLYAIMIIFSELAVVICGLRISIQDRLNNRELFLV